MNAHVTITLNGEPRALTPGTTVTGLVADLGHECRGIAVAINEVVVPRGVWADTEVRVGDRVEVLRAAQGGC